jgi:hypothetical protein
MTEGLKSQRLITILCVLIALPAVLLVAQGLFSSIGISYGRLIVGKIVFPGLFVAAVILVTKFFSRSSQRQQQLQIVAIAVHLLAFSVLIYWFSGIARVFRHN